MPEYVFSSKTSRKLSLQTYLANLPEWSSSTRLASLYSEFDKLKETNPFGYEANISWWRSVILGAARNGLLSSYQPHANYNTSATHHHSTAHSSTDSGSSGAAAASKSVCEPTGSAIGVLELDLDQLAAKFQKNGRRPHSLLAVMNEMHASGEVIPRSDFLPWAGVGWTGWIFHKVVKAPLLWSLKQLSISDSSSSPVYPASSPILASSGFGSPGGAGSGSSGKVGVGGSTGAGSNGLALGISSSASVASTHRDTYVIVSFVQEAAARILKIQQESTSYHASDNLMTFADFRQKFSRTALLPIRGKLTSDATTGAGSVIILTDRDLEIVMRYMQYELKVLVTGKLDANKQGNEVQDHEMVVKFANKDVIRDKSKQEVTTPDRGIIELRQTCKRLDNQVQDIEERISQLTEKARACVKKNQKSQATFALRQRKNLEDVLNKRLTSLDTLSSILFRIQSSETDAEVLQSYKLGASTLASVMATKDENGQQMLSRDNVESAMDRLADVFADQQEVDQAMNEGTAILLESTTPGGIDEDDLMAELDALMGQQHTTTATPAHKETPAPVETAAPNKQPSIARPIPIKRTTPPIPNEPMSISPTNAREHSASAPGKRVAEIPEQASVYAKQRKVSQTSVHSQRRNSGETQGHDGSSHSSSRERLGDAEAAMVTEVPEEDTAKLSRMETDRSPNATATAVETSKPITSGPNEDEGLSLEEQRDLEAMMRELEEIRAPEEDITMEKEEPERTTGTVEHANDGAGQDRDTEGVQERSKARKETRMMEHS
ncbi:hypothetical protein BGZ54_000026 [Gamsiella multidivaricata]|nr:hypothetical protein BGZ54_000026 [Gamsiella multidivaricata]